MADYTKEIKEEFVTRIDAKIKELEEKQVQWAVLQNLMQKNADEAPNKIVLDIGGKRFATSKTTLLGAEGSFFHAMLASGRWKPDQDGTYFVDRNPKLFPVILDYLRMGKLSLNKFGYDVTEDLKNELDFYQIKIPELFFSIEDPNSYVTENSLRFVKQWAPSP